MSDLLASLGLEFINPATLSSGLKQLKPSSEPQIFSVISSWNGKDIGIKYRRHNFWNQLKKNIRCHGGSCCVKADELAAALNALPDGDERKRQKPKAQLRYIFPVVLYQGKTVNAYGGPIEVRYLDISSAVYEKWNQSSAAVNVDIAPYYERDFVMTEDASIKGVPIMTHTESRAKWMTDPALNASVLEILNAPEFIENYTKVIPPQMTDSDFLDAWNSAMISQQSTQTEAEKMLKSEPIHVQTQPIAPNPYVQPQVAYTNANTVDVPQAVSCESAIQPVNVTPVQPVLQQAVPNAGISTNVPFTPQNIINGTYSAGTLTNVITPEAAINMQPVNIPVQPVVVPTQATTEIAPVQPAVAPAVAPSQAEINLADIGDLDSIINSLP